MLHVFGLNVHKDNAFVYLSKENDEKIQFKTNVVQKANNRMLIRSLFDKKYYFCINSITSLAWTSNWLTYYISHVEE